MEKRVITFHYVLKNGEGEVLDESTGGEPLSFVEGKHDIIRGLEEAMKSLKVGDKKHIPVPAALAYGEYDENAVAELPKTQFASAGEVAVGDAFRLSHEGQTRVCTVVEIKKDTIILDANHPLAGEDLFFDVEVTEIRAAGPEDEADDHGDCCGGHS